MTRCRCVCLGGVGGSGVVGGVGCDYQVTYGRGKWVACCEGLRPQYAAPLVTTVEGLVNDTLQVGAREGGGYSWAI
jgi:hypothetical protein